MSKPSEIIFEKYANKCEEKGLDVNSFPAEPYLPVAILGYLDEERERVNGILKVLIARVAPLDKEDRYLLEELENMIEGLSTNNNE